MARSQDPRRQKFVSNGIWNKNEELIIKNLNTEHMLHPFTQEGLISFDDVENYRRLKLSTEQSEYIFNAIPKCGKNDYLVVFLNCVNKTFEDTGQAHKQLVAKLEADYEAAMNDTSYKLPPEPCVVIVKRNRCWIISYSISLLWLLAGIIASIALTQLPAVQPIHPSSLRGLADPIMAEVDIGIHPFWLSSVSFQLVPESEPSLSCVADLYVLNNHTCRELPTVTEYHTRESGTLLSPPYYLLEGSVLNMTIGNHTSRPETMQFSVFYVEGTTQDCNGFNVGGCQSAPSELTVSCRVGERGQTLETYRASSSNFYAFCSEGFFGNSYTLKALTYNVSEVRRNFRPRATLSSTAREPYLVSLSNGYNLGETNYCMLLDVDRTDNRCTGSSSFTLQVDIQRRIDFSLLSFFIGVALSIIHILVTGLAHCCCVCRRKRN